jgi:hypothetical protein
LEVYSKVKHKKLRILDLLVKLTNSSCHTTGRKRKIFATIKTNAIGIRGGDMCYTLIERPISKRGETTHVPPLEFYIDRFVENHKRKF